MEERKHKTLTTQRDPVTLVAAAGHDETGAAHQSNDTACDAGDKLATDKEDATTCGDEPAEKIGVSGDDEVAEKNEAARLAFDVQSSDHDWLAERERLGLPSSYAQLRFVGEGGMSVVYKAVDTENEDRIVAIKMLKEELSRDTSVIERFEREVAAMKTLSHQNIVQIFDSGVSTKGIPFFSSEYIDGGTLADAIEREGHLQVERSRRIFVQICSALEFAHARKIVHRDIKPSNILLCHDSDGNEIAKLADFGIAKPPTSEPLFNTDLTRTGMILGSPAYMSPEQCKGWTVDERSDIYSLGCVMYETLSGKSPFAAENPIKAIVRHLEESPQPFVVEHKRLGIPKGLEDVVMKCLEKEAKHRFQTVCQLGTVLSSAVRPARVRRYWAYLLDVAIFLGCSVLIVPLLSRLGDVLVEFFVWPLILYSLYFGGFESSPLQATPAKLLFGLQVRAKDGRRLDLLSALIFPLLMVSTFLLVAVTPDVFYFLLPTKHRGVAEPFPVMVFYFLVSVSFGICWVIDKFIGSRIRAEGRPITSAQPASFDGWRTKILALIAIITVSVVGFTGARQLATYVANSGDIPVVAAAAPIMAGTRIQDKDLIVLHVPRFLAPALPVVSNKNEVVGRIAEVDIYNHEPLSRDEVLPLPMEKANYKRHTEVFGLYPTVTAIYDPATGMKMTPENAKKLLDGQPLNIKRWQTERKSNNLNLPKGL